MGSLLHPVGSQPSWVYWARRGAVVLAVVLVVAALVFVFRPQPPSTVVAVPATTSPSPAVTSPVPTASGSPSPSASPTPTGPLVCDATNSAVGLSAFRKVKQDAKQVFKVSITNSGKQPCVLTLSPTTFTLAVTSGTDKIWTTDDCEKWVPTHKQTLKSKGAYEFAITWPVARSAPGCKLAKSVLGAGTYVANAAFAEDAKAVEIFVVTKA